MCSYGLHFPKYAEDRVGPYTQPVIKMPSPSILVEVVMRLKLLLLPAAATNSREVSHPMSAMMDMPFYHSWIFLLGFNQR